MKAEREGVLPSCLCYDLEGYSDQIPQDASFRRPPALKPLVCLSAGFCFPDRNSYFMDQSKPPTAFTTLPPFRALRF
ncbi:hypothetical protein NPIL_405821 [Nephila pilipes]|uniref:Uncharacterized protein n=1 Tax=Nephila pilipes TaxID=299642 RepID=A0A8X6PT89_NEPPI|nr:hypothetical protein NPIL_405821 [Nephila pilipes]